MEFRYRVALAAGTLLLGSCVAGPDLGKPIQQVHPASGYRYSTVEPVRRNDDLLMMVSFSGGGTRAAAFSYGVLRQLSRDSIRHDGLPKRLLDEVDIISAVSGGGVTAATYAVHGEQIFVDFERQFLKHNMQRSLWLAVLNPFNLARLASSRFARGDLFAEVLDRRIFHGATYADLTSARGRPFLILNTTDLSTTAHVEFTQSRFDTFCLDLSPVRVARAVSASSASPPVSTPITFRNFGGHCGHAPPVSASAPLSEPHDSRVAALANEHLVYESPAIRYLHLADGALSDNLGVRTAIDTLTAMTDIDRSTEALGLAAPRRIVYILVNAANQPGLAVARKARAPDELQAARLAAAAAIDRQSTENRLMLRDLLRDLQQRLARTRPTELYFIDVDPNSLADAAQRARLLTLPTNLKLDQATADLVICSAQEILARSPEYLRMLRDLGGMPAIPPRCASA